jgi:integrase
VDFWSRGLIDRRYFKRHTWKTALEAVGVEPTRKNGIHALRRHYASTLLEGGVSIRAHADYLGHADPGFTLRVYAHLMPESEERARTVVDISLRSAIGQSSQGTADALSGQR